MGHSLLAQAFIYLLAAVCSVPIAKRLGLGSVLGYLTAGMIIGPFALSLVGEQGDVMHFAEFGVVMMLFLVGLELQPGRVWRMRAPILGMGGLQITLTAGAFLGVGLALGLSWQIATAVGIILAMSSTAIALQSLGEKGLLKTEGGQSAFAILLCQDIAVIPILAALPLLAFANLDPAVGGTVPVAAGGIAALPGWQQALVIVGVIALIVVGGRFLMRPAFRFVAGSRLREMFTASALLLVIGVALAMESVGLSPALGTFLAGVVLADNEFRHELESDIEPFKGLLLGLFFISVGASINFTLLVESPLPILAGVVLLVAIKLTVLWVVGVVFRLPRSQTALFSFALAQGGEFAFVLIGFSVQNGVFGTDIAAPMVVVVALSMVVAPLLLILNERLVQPRFSVVEEAREADAIDEENPVILAGFGRFGQIVGRLLLANGVRITVLDHDVSQIETLRKFGFKVFYGDTTRLDLLEAAGAAQARLLIIAIDDAEKATRLAEQARRHFPHLRILARAYDLVHAYDLMAADAHGIRRETFGSAVDLGVDALCGLGFRAYQAHRAALAFRAHDEASIRELIDHRHDQKVYVSMRQRQHEELERLLEKEIHDAAPQGDHAWDAAPREDGDA